MAKILVVEDDALLSKLYTTMLTNRGHAVTTAGDGEEGLKKVAEVTPDLVMLDIMMPKMNGLQVLDALKQNPATAQIPVVVLTGLSKVNEKESVLARGANYYLDKQENDPKVVAELIEKLVGAVAPATATAATQPSEQPGK